MNARKGQKSSKFHEKELLFYFIASTRTSHAECNHAKTQSGPLESQYHATQVTKTDATQRIRFLGSHR